MSRRRSPSRALRDIERDLADSDPGLDAFFLSFTRRTWGREMPQTETIPARRLNLLAWLRRERTSPPPVTRTG